MGFALFWCMVCVVVGVAGGGPAASHFSCFAKKSNQKKANPISRRAKARDSRTSLKVSGAPQLVARIFL